MIQKQFFTIVILLLLLAGCGRSPGDAQRVYNRETIADQTETGETTPTTTPVSTAGGTTILANGQVVAVNPPLPLSFKIGGRLLALQVESGDQVKADDLIATLDDEALREAQANAELAVTQAENNLAQAQLTLDELLKWKPDEMAVSVAEANLAAAEANLEMALKQDAAAGNSLTTAQVSLQQAERALTDAQKAYDNAWDEARDWELNYDKPICLPGQGGSIPCTGITWKERIENDRDFTTRALQNAKDSLTVSRANYNLALAGLSDNRALEAEAAVANAQQSLRQAQTGPKENEITAARLQVEQAQLSLQQAEFDLDQALRALENAKLYSPGAGTVLSVDAAPGAIVASGMPVVTLLDTEYLQFHTSNLSERDLAYIKPGQLAEISLKTYPSQPISGTVNHIAPQSSGTVGDAATFTVVIDIEGTELALWPGMTGRTEIQREAD